MSHPVADFLHELYLISGVSVPETICYPALSRLLNGLCLHAEPVGESKIHAAGDSRMLIDSMLAP